MTQINSAAVLPSQMAAQPDSVSGQTGNSFISSLSNVKPEQAAALADKTFLALGKDGIKFLPFLTSFVKAFQQSNAGGSAPATPGGTAGAGGASNSGGAANVDVGAATQALLAFRNANGGVKNLDQAIGAIAKALPSLSQADFDSLMNSLKATTSAAQSSPGMPAMPTMPTMPAMPKAGGTNDQFGQSMNLATAFSSSAQPEIDKFEMGLLESQIAAAVGKNTTAAASATGNKALDAVIGAITEIGKDGVTADEMESLIGILSATATALLGPEKAEKALANLGLPGSSGSSGSSGSPASVQISVSADESSSTPGTNPAGSSIGRNSYDPMLTVKTNLLRNATASNRDPSSTNEMAYQLFIAGNSALSGGISSGQEFSKAKAESKKPVSSVDLS